MKAQAPAGVDVPTALFFYSADQGSNTCASFCANAWLCACQGTDRDLVSPSTMKKVNAWICASLTTEHDPASVIPDKKRKFVTTVMFCGPVFDEMVFELINDLHL